MAKKTLFPSDAELARVRELLSNSIGSKPLAKNASAVDKIKYEICKEFIIYKNQKS